ncbi:MAG: DUF115 domain-containing protein [Desulfobacteraceae bacterium]|nr:DUF115 domain-containing protein [Desulfobacteraceae bacterium]
MSIDRPDFFDANMKLLKKNHPYVWKMINKTEIKPEGEIVIAKNGEPNLLTKDINGNKVFLHILENPKAEINDLLNVVKETFDGTLIITGMGLGHCPSGIIKLRKNLRHLVVFEPNTGIFLQALKANDLSILLSDHRVILGIGDNQNIADTMAPALKALQLEDIQHVQHKPSFSLNFSKYNTLYKDINIYTSSANIEGNTFLAMGNDFFTNRLKNLNSIHHNYSFDDLKEKFKDIPAILVSAGPSLDMNIHILKQAQGKAIIISADSALPSLIANDIMPDFVTTIDPLELIFEKVANVTKQLNGVSLVCMSWASSKMAKLFPADKVFWCYGLKHIEKWIGDLVGCKTRTTGASSVAHLNFLTASWMKCSPIVFVGQDLAFSQSKSHSSDTNLANKDYNKDLLKDEKNIIWLDGVNNKKVLSNRLFHSQKRYFETMIKKLEGHYINSTAEGCHIEGTEVMPLQKVIDHFCTIKIDTKKIVNLPTKKNPAILRIHLIKELQKKIKRCQQIQKMIKETKYLLNDLLKALNKSKKLNLLYKSFNDLSISNQKKIIKLDKIGEKLDKAHDIWPLMQEVTLAGLRQSEQQKHAIDQLANDPDHYTEWLKKNFQRLNTINKIRNEVLPLFQDTIKESVSLLESEGTLFATLDKQNNLKKYNQALIQLISLYFDAGNIALAQPWLEKLSENLPASGETNFFQGITAAHYTEYDKAEAFFEKACKADPINISKIEKFREHQENAYISYAQFFDNRDKTVARKLLLKGLIYAPEHKRIKQELKLRSDQTITEIKSHETAGTLPETEDMIDSWLDDLSSNKQLAYIIGDDNASQLYQYKGIILTNNEELDSAIMHFNKSLDILPENPALHILLTNIYFAKQEYPQGIYHLKQAVSLDSVYAVYWEEIGDELMQSGQFEDALAAFENCFVILPERVHLLKKIGDCYKETGQLEAAREAYTKLNILLKES